MSTLNLVFRKTMRNKGQIKMFSDRQKQRQYRCSSRYPDKPTTVEMLEVQNTPASPSRLSTLT
jgi:hypothetical protein